MVPAHPLTGAIGAVRGAAVAAFVFLAVVGCADDGADLGAFCAEFDRLAQDDPFEGLDVASPGEMRDAFEDLRRGAETLDSTAPSEVAVQADRYRAAVEALDDQLRGAGFDLRELDLAAYRRGTGNYAEAAVSLENAASDLCD